MCNEISQLKWFTKFWKGQKRFWKVVKRDFFKWFSTAVQNVLMPTFHIKNPSSPFVGNHWDYQKKETNKSLDRLPKGAKEGGTRKFLVLLVVNCILLGPFPLLDPLTIWWPPSAFGTRAITKWYMAWCGKSNPNLALTPLSMEDILKVIS